MFQQNDTPTRLPACAGRDTYAFGHPAPWFFVEAVWAQVPFEWHPSFLMSGLFSLRFFRFCFCWCVSTPLFCSEMGWGLFKPFLWTRLFLVQVASLLERARGLSGAEKARLADEASALTVKDPLLSRFEDLDR